MKRFFIGLALAGLTAAGAEAANISGSVEASYNFNLSVPDSMSSNGGSHAYDQTSKTFTLNSAHLVVSGSDSASGIGYDVETDIGSDARVDASASGTFFDIQEAYLTYAFGPDRAWGMKAGKYATYQGIEVVEGGANPTITRGFIYWLAEPVTHTGVEVSYAAAMWDVHFGLVNGWDQVIDVNTMPTVVAKVGINMGNPLALTLSTLIGSEVPNAYDATTGAFASHGTMKNMRMTFDATGVTKAIPMTDFWFQANYGKEAKAALDPANLGKDATWLGVGVQPLVHISDLFGLGLRYEYFKDANGYRTGSGIKDFVLQNISLAPTFWLTKYLTARVEYRMDMSSEKAFIDKDSKPVKQQSEVSADVVATF